MKQLQRPTSCGSLQGHFFYVEIVFFFLFLKGSLILNNIFMILLIDVDRRNPALVDIKIYKDTYIYIIFQLKLIITIPLHRFFIRTGSLDFFQQ